jgi:hypothetical protein
VAGAGTVRVLYNRGYDNNEYTARAVVVVVVVVAGNVDSWGSFCYSLACSSVACLGAGGDSVCFCFYRILTKLVRGDVPLLFVVAKIGARCGASFVKWWFDTVLLVQMVVRMGCQSISKVEILRRTHDYTE